MSAFLCGVLLVCVIWNVVERDFWCAAFNACVCVYCAIAWLGVSVSVVRATGILV